MWNRQGLILLVPFAASSMRCRHHKDDDRMVNPAIPAIMDLKPRPGWPTRRTKGETGVAVGGGRVVGTFPRVPMRRLRQCRIGLRGLCAHDSACCVLVDVSLFLSLTSSFGERKPSVLARGDFVGWWVGFEGGLERISMRFDIIADATKLATSKVGLVS